jgi:hypothetical protein
MKRADPHILDLLHMKVRVIVLPIATLDQQTLEFGPSSIKRIITPSQVECIL